MKAIREAEWSGLARARPEAQSRTDEACLRRDARGGRPVACAPCSNRQPRRRRRHHPARRPGPDADGARRRLARSPSSPRRPGVPVLTPAKPGDPEFLARLRELSVEACPVVAYGALLPPAALDVPHARLGQPALLAAAGLARRRAGPARDPARRRDHRSVDVPHRGRPRHRAGVRGRHRGDPPDRHGRRPARPACGLRRRPAARDDGRHRRRLARPACRSRPTACRSPARSPSADAAGAVGLARPPRRPAGSGVHAGPGRVDDVARRAAQARPGAAARRATSWPPASCGSTRAASQSGRRPPRSSSARCSRRASGRCLRPTGRAARGSNRARRLG